MDDLDWEAYELPDVILNPPEKYDRIRNRFGVCGRKPNLYYNGHVHRIWVTHAVDGVESLGGVEEYIDAYGGGWDYGNEEAREEMREAVEQALDFHDEYADAFEEVRVYREWQIEQLRKRDDAITGPEDLEE